MITPFFNLTQNDDFVIVHITIPSYQQFGNGDVAINGNQMVYHSHPYFLSLTFNNEIAKDGSEKAEIDRLDCKLHVYIPKATKGEVFPDLDVLPLFLTKKKVLSRVEVTGKNTDFETLQNESEKTQETFGGQEEMLRNFTAEDLQKMKEIEAKRAEKIEKTEKEEPHEKLDFFDRNDLILGEDQIIRERDESIKMTIGKYGFNSSHSGVFIDLNQSAAEIVMVNNPETATQYDRHNQRVEDENKNFDRDRYISDTFEWEYMDDVMGNNSFVWKTTEWMDEEKDEANKTPHLDVAVEDGEQKQLFRDLFQIVFGFVYDQIVMGDTTVESAWTIATLAPVLSYLDEIETAHEVVSACVRRGVTYPLVRNYDLAKKAIEETLSIFEGGKSTLVRMVLRIHRIFKLDELKHYLCFIFLDEFTVWAPKSSDDIRFEVTKELRNAFDTITKDGLGLPLLEAEQVYIDYMNSMDEAPNEVKENFLN
ncbi:hypothetical protein EIN_018680 [Entamoeba invadens IP1]|uniref:hypothetical protein n=1 Tax=Entamoeba invadens IP1 TaxID=370355 RepID=UPI0002C3E63C|nr:hypothetical protein EIN_018680 [Entamoeba invadens IP1]ELP90509.1 hypothetical protein EIN_018680 [Entamoeba invadens IP1]|eukprot:XP_004257280.1 hypothetical protein EIN_018680 [Entamoeba invadens IP1]